MNEKYRVSLSVAMELKEAGFPQDECDGYWCEETRGKVLDIKLFDRNTAISRKHNSPDLKQWAAPCVGRLYDEIGTFAGTVAKADDIAKMWMELKKDGLL